MVVFRINFTVSFSLPDAADSCPLWPDVVLQTIINCFSIICISFSRTQFKEESKPNCIQWRWQWLVFLSVAGDCACSIVLLFLQTAAHKMLAHYLTESSMQWWLQLRQGTNPTITHIKYVQWPWLVFLSVAGNSAYIIGTLAESELGCCRIMALARGRHSESRRILGDLTRMLTFDDAESVMNAAGTMGTLVSSYMCICVCVWNMGAVIDWWDVVTEGFGVNVVTGWLLYCVGRWRIKRD